MSREAPVPRPDAQKVSGPAKDFSNFIELELERRRSSDTEFDLGLFEEAVELVLHKLRS
jgi:hypothetical protein